MNRTNVCNNCEWILLEFRNSLYLFKVGWCVVLGCLKNYFKGCLSKCCSCKLFISLSRKSCMIISLGFFPYLSWSAVFEWGYFHFPLCLFKSRLFFLLMLPILITLIKAFELIVCGWTTWLCVNLWDCEIESFVHFTIEMESHT